MNSISRILSKKKIKRYFEIAKDVSLGSIERIEVNSEGQLVFYQGHMAIIVDDINYDILSSLIDELNDLAERLLLEEEYEGTIS
jgi:hypothetical protein